MNLKLEFTNMEITPCGGITLMKKMFNNMNINEIISNLPLPNQLPNRGYAYNKLIKNFWIGIWVKHHFVKLCSFIYRVIQVKLSISHEKNSGLHDHGKNQNILTFLLFLMINPGLL